MMSTTSSPTTNALIGNPHLDPPITMSLILGDIILAIVVFYFIK